jgi:hypothetical protein
MISKEYRKQNQIMHANGKFDGHDALIYLPEIEDAKKRFNVQSTLDFGCGTGVLPDTTRYDPCVPVYAAYPEPHDMVVSTDVLEHIEPEHLLDTLQEIADLTLVVGFHAICLEPDKSKLLPDGRNPHQSLHLPKEWVDMHAPLYSKVTVRHSPRKNTLCLEVVK